MHMYHICLTNEHGCGPSLVGGPGPLGTPLNPTLAQPALQTARWSDLCSYKSLFSNHW